MSDHDERLRAIEESLAQIKERNLRVESDKAWERSKTRIALICLVTYVIAAAVFYCLGSPKPYLDAFVPTVGFFLSAQSLPLAKKLWTNACFRSKD